MTALKMLMEWRAEKLRRPYYKRLWSVSTAGSIILKYKWIFRRRFGDIEYDAGADGGFHDYRLLDDGSAGKQWDYDMELLLKSFGGREREDRARV